MGDNAKPSTVGKVISCKAGVCWGMGQKLIVEEIDVAPPQAGEVRIEILYTTICQSDVVLLNNPAFAIFPRIAGHEGSGIVESVGEGVTGLVPGDHVLPIFIGECMQCKLCKSGKTNTCERAFVSGTRGTMMHDNTSRFSIKGQPIYHGYSSTFSQFTVVEKEYVVKINPAAPLDKVVLLSCGAATGLGSVWNIAKAEPGSTVAIFGLGAVGLGVAEGARVAGASRIIGVDTVNSKAEFARSFGMTDFVNPKDHDKPVDEVIVEMTSGGVDYAFECVGYPKVMRSAFECCHESGGLAIIHGVTPRNVTMELAPRDLLHGKSLVGSMYGGWRPQSDIPGLVERYLRKDFEIDSLITHRLPLSEINEALAMLADGTSLRTVLIM